VRSGSGIALVAGLGLLLLAWAIGNAPFTSPDEAGHFTRAASLVRGQLVGDPAGPGPQATGREGLRLQFGQETTRRVTIPASIDPEGLGCDALHPDMPATCTQSRDGLGSVQVESAVATYDPLPSVVPGLATLVVTSNATASLRAARIAGALLALALLALGLSSGRGLWTRAGVCLALTPGTLFVLASVNPNSLEIAGAVACAVPLFRLAATGALERRGIVSMALGGVAMVASRPTSIGWLGVAAVAAAVCSDDLRRTLRTRRSLRVAGLCWVAAILASVLWETLVEPSPPRGLNGASLRAAISFIPEMVREYLGVFGSLDTRPPAALSLPLLAAFAGLLATALLRAGARARCALLLVLAAILVLPVALNATVLWFTGFALQGRHVTALIVLAPILAGVALDARGIRLPALARVAIAAAWAFSQVAFWLYNAHRHAVGVAGSWDFLGRDPAWLPGPFLVWAAVALAGAMLGGAALVSRQGLAR
jgi:Predicted membrane protein (DUF2142)